MLKEDEATFESNRECIEAFSNTLLRNEDALYRRLIEMTNHYAKLFEGADECSDEERIEAIADYF